MVNGNVLSSEKTSRQRQGTAAGRCSRDPTSRRHRTWRLGGARAFRLALPIAAQQWASVLDGWMAGWLDAQAPAYNWLLHLSHRTSSLQVMRSAWARYSVSGSLPGASAAIARRHVSACCVARRWASRDRPGRQCAASRARSASHETSTVDSCAAAIRARTQAPAVGRMPKRHHSMLIG